MVPTMTVSPFLTTGSAGAPMCMDMGMTTCSGTGILLVGCPAVAFVCGTAAPLAERFRDLNNLISPVSLIFLVRQVRFAPLHRRITIHFNCIIFGVQVKQSNGINRLFCPEPARFATIFAIDAGERCIKINNPTKKMDTCRNKCPFLIYRSISCSRSSARI